MTSPRILIVEDEVLIADTLARYLRQQGYFITGTAISYEEAVDLYRQKRPDLVLIDIRLNGSRTGIDLAHYIRSLPQPAPFIYLTSQLDRHNIDLAKATFPAAYLSKPIQKATLYATIEIVLHNNAEPAHHRKITLTDKVGTYHVFIRNILYLQADHVYVRVQMLDGSEIVQRSSLGELLEQLPASMFLQTHRSFAVNIQHISQWDTRQVYIGDQAIPISRSRRPEVMAALNVSYSKF